MFGTLVQVAVGGAIGAVFRFATVAMATRAFGGTFPFGTFAVNVVGSLLMGIVFVALAERDALRYAPFLMAGVLGGFTTFSAFSLDAYRLYVDGALGAAAIYVFGSVLLSILALIVGVVAGRGLFG